MNVYQFTADRVTASAKLNVYLTGTTTPATFYTDAAGTSTGTSPVTADGAGQFAPIYLDPSITYRIKVTNSAGSTTYYDIDPVRSVDEGTADGVLMVRSVDDAKKRTVPANVSAVYCAGYANKNDRGQALYVRVASLPSHAGKFTSADGAFWELSENILNPFMFGAKGDDTTNDSPAIQAMFNLMVTKARPYPFNFMGAKYYVHDKITLPTISLFLSIDINGGGATLRTDQAITIFERLATSEANAAAVIASCHYDIHHFEFLGTQADGQIGLHIAAAYTNVVRTCSLSSLQYGSIGTFCLASAWRDNLYHFCTKRGLVLQSGAGYVQWHFENWPANFYLQLKNPAHWENATLPSLMHVRGMHVAGMMEWSPSGSTFISPVRFQDGSTIAGMQQGIFSLPLSISLSANSEVTETISVPGLKGTTDVVIVNPVVAFLPPAGLVWNAWVHDDDVLKLRLVNTSASTIALPNSASGTIGMTWRFSAPRHG